MYSSLLVSILFLAVRPAPEGCSDSAQGVKGFIEVVLASQDEPTLEQYYRFHPSGEEFEAHFEAHFCLDYLLCDEVFDAVCVDYLRDRFGNQNSESSMYFAWLRNVIPNQSAEFAIRGCRDCDPSPRYPEKKRNIMTVQYGDTELEFVTMGCEDGECDGVSLFSIGGVHVWDLLQNEHDVDPKD